MTPNPPVHMNPEKEGREGRRERGSEDPLESMTDGSLADKSALVKSAESSGDWPRLPDGKIRSLPFLGLCQGGGRGAQSKERKGSNFAV